jgi:hypothetical protein
MVCFREEQMSIFFINEGTFDVDDGWNDRSVTALTFPSGMQTPEASFTVTRDSLAPGAGSTVGDYVDEQLSRLARSCPQFDLIRRDDTTISEQPGQLVEFTWKTPEGKLVRQIQGVLISNGTALMMTGTSPKDRFPDFSEAFHSMIGSFRLRE